MAFVNIISYCTYLIMFARSFVYSTCRRPASTLLKRPQNQSLHAYPSLGLPRRKDFFSSNSYSWQKQSKNGNNSEEPTEPQTQRRRGGRSPAAPTSLRRVAVEAQRSKDGFLTKSQLKDKGLYRTKVPFLNANVFFPSLF